MRKREAYGLSFFNFAKIFKFMLQYNYIPLLCHTCGTIINIRANGSRMVYHHKDQVVKVKEVPFVCPACEQQRISFIEYLEDQEILAIEDDDVFKEVVSTIRRPGLLSKRYATT
jgi:predicted RNA-binding Zn-ribbon protein involved in translation (DUF1610 family)